MSQNNVGQSPKVRRFYSREEKLAAVKRSFEIGVQKASQELGIVEGNFNRWRRQFREGGEDALKQQSSRPKHQPKLTSRWIIDKIVAIKNKRPEMGAVAMSDHLARFESVQLSSNTIAKVFKKQGLPDGDAGHAESSYHIKGDKDKKLENKLEAELGEWQRFSRPLPNDLWQMDIMSFYIRNAHTVYLISALDDCSRFIVNWGLFKKQTAENVLEVLRGGLAKHGAPREVLTDQGSQFKSWKGVTQFEKLLAKLKIQHIKSRSHHPQTAGKIEAFHRNIQRELIDREFFISMEQAVEQISRYIEHYNYGRPHQAIDGYTPSDRYFDVINSVKKYLADFQQPKNEMEEKEEKIGVGHGSKLYLIGKVLGQDIRLQELAGRLTIHVNNQPFKDINLVQ